MTRDNYLTKVLSSCCNPTKAQQTANAKKYPQGYFKEKACRHCGVVFTPKAPSELYCSDFCKDYAVTNAYYQRVYHISLKTYIDIAERQNFVCAICGKGNFPMGEHHTGCLVVDHDHKRGLVRGLLCHNCNRALGLFQDKSEIIYRAFSYLQSVTTIPKGSTPKQVEAVDKVI